jgi:hypothetical protein
MGSAFEELKRSRFEAANTAATGSRSPDARDPWLVISSELLGEDVLYVRDPKSLEAARAAHPGLVSYATAEIEVLYAYRDNADAIKAIHRIKKKFGGRVRAPDAIASIDARVPIGTASQSGPHQTFE